MGESLSETGGGSGPSEKLDGPQSIAPKKKKRHHKKHIDAFRKLKQLPNFDAVHQKLASGISCENVADWLQQKCDQYTDVKRDSLVRQLYLYRKTIPPTERRGVEVDKLEAELQAETHKVDELRETNLLYEYTKKRIGKLIEIEKANMVGVHPQLSPLVTQAAHLLIQINNLKRQLGQIPGAPGFQITPDEQEFDTLRNGAMAVIVKQYGPRAHEVLTKVGKSIMENLKQIPAPKSTDPEAEIVDYTIESTISPISPSSNGNGVHPV